MLVTRAVGVGISNARHRNEHDVVRPLFHDAAEAQ